MAFGQIQCSRSNDFDQPQAAPFDTSFTPASPSFSLALAGNSLDLVFADRNSSALVLAEILASASSNPPFVSGVTTYLDRISDMPGTDPLFGAHLFFAEGQDRHLLYIDRKADERMLLKYIHWGSDGGKASKATIDVLPFIGRPLAAFRDEDGMLEVCYETNLQLYRRSLKPTATAEILRSPFSSAGAVSMLDGQGVHGFTAFDEPSRRLLLFRRNGLSFDQTSVARFGVVHSSAVADDGTVSILAFDQQKSRIVLFQQTWPGADFHDQPVCPGREVRCLAMFSYRGSSFFLFSEQTDPRTRKDPYQLSLLIPEVGARTLKYHRHILSSGSQPFPFFRTVLAGDLLYVGFLQGSVRLLRLELKNYLRSVSD
jgi:hypothetical protein